MFDALDAGTTFCFVHFNERVPPYDKFGYETGQMDREGMQECYQGQIGYRWLDRFSIKPIQTDYLLLSGKLHRTEFKRFLDKWGTSHNFFSTYNKAKFDDVILAIDDHVMAFSLNVRNSRIIYLPFQRDFSRKDDFVDAIQTLIDALLTYITRSLTELPSWASQPFFQEEANIQSDCDELERKLEETREHLQIFEEAKSLLFQSEYELESLIPKFIVQNLEILTERDEKYKEDFWILNRDEEKAIISEVKSVVKGFKKSAIFSLYNHRETNGLDEDFPAVLVANCNLQAGSWEDKDRPIDKQDFQVAAQNNILIVRIEDLLRLWDLRRSEKISSEEIFNLLLNEKGWLQVNPDLEINVNA
jgi:hypothetical protein